MQVKTPTIEDCLITPKGHRWFCRLPDFVSYMVSPYGFDKTHESAYFEFMISWRYHQKRKKMKDLI